MRWHTPPANPARTALVEQARKSVGADREKALRDLVKELAFGLGITSSNSVTPPAMPDRGILETLRYFIVMVGIDPFEGHWFKYVTGIDFHQEVTATDLLPGTKLVTFESRPAGRPKPFLYFARAGSSPTNLGTSFSSYQYVEYEVRFRVQALSSYASGIRFDEWDMVSRLGGGKQYIVHAGGASYITKKRVGRLV
jgi:hypothetical protein